MWGRSSTKRANLSIALLSAALISTSLLASTAQAQVRVRPSTVWGHTFAGNSAPAANATTAKSSPSANLEKLSKFAITYNAFPIWARTEVQAALDTWAANFKSAVDITVTATWGRSANSDVLGSARPGSYFAGFIGAPDSTLWYPSALANALAGKDLDRDNAEIIIQVNSTANWNERGDDKPRTTEYDLQSVILHEMAHGLGFISGNYYDELSGLGRILQPTPFDAYAQLPDGRRLADMPNSSLETGKALTSTLMWSGENGIKANNGVKPLLYTPSNYEPGSSVSHLDEKTFSQSGDNATMTPNLDSGEVFHLPGSLLLAMFEDMRRKPPAGVTYGLPDPPQNFRAIISDQSAILMFELPANFRSAQIESYLIKNIKTGEQTTASESPVVINGLKNGLDYSFSIVAKNAVGESPSALSNSVTPEAAWKASVIDSKADAKYLATAIYQGKPVIAYSDSKNGNIKLATYLNNKWSIKTIDGNSSLLGKTPNDVSGYLSMCTSVDGKTNYLHIFYSDLKDKDLRYALFDGKNWEYEIVDGNGPNIQDYKEAVRVRGGSDVSVSNACAVTEDGVQVFYRDESQGILLGAVKNVVDWSYEIVDGDKDTEGRTTGDVAFHLKSAKVGSKVHLIYDSVRGFDQDKNVTRGEVRYSTRSSSAAEDWSYKTLDIPSTGVAVSGYDVGIFNGTKGLNVGWFTGTITSFPNPNNIRFQLLTAKSATNVAKPEFGIPNSPISIDDKTILYGCQQRLCALTSANRSVSLVSNGKIQSGAQSSWISLNKIRYAVAGVSGKLTLLKP